MDVRSFINILYPSEICLSSFSKPFLYSFIPITVRVFLPHLYVSHCHRWSFHICQEWSFCPLFPVQFSMSHSSWVCCLLLFAWADSNMLHLLWFPILLSLTSWGLVFRVVLYLWLNWAEAEDVDHIHVFIEKHCSYNIISDVIL